MNMQIPKTSCSRYSPYGNYRKNSYNNKNTTKKIQEEYRNSNIKFVSSIIASAIIVVGAIFGFSKCKKVNTSNAINNLKNTCLKFFSTKNNKGVVKEAAHSKDFREFKKLNSKAIRKAKHINVEEKASEKAIERYKNILNKYIANKTK